MLIEDENVMPDMLGRNIGQYQLIELLGKGNTSYVYKAFQPAMSRYVAVKLLFPSLAASPDFMEQFQRRLALMASLQHSHILPLYDYGQEEEFPYLVTRYVAAGTLQDYLPDYYSPQAALRIIQPLAAALEYGHNQGLIHANLNPENILIDEGQRPMLADFGGLRQEPVIPLVSNAYTSPEQVQGLPVDRPSDVYGLGALLYTLLVGEPPPSDRVPTPRAYRPNLASALEKVILKAMAPAPQQRFRSAAEFSRALERALQPQAPVVTASESTLTTTEREPIHIPAPDTTQDSRRVTGIVMFVATLALLAGVAVIYFIFFGRDDTAVVPTAPPGVAMVTANTDVNVRAGPGTAYEAVGVMRQGQNAEAIGVSPDSGWWVISFPAVAAGRGWISDQFVSATGTGNLPIIQPPPLPATGEPPAASTPVLTDEPPVEATGPLPPSPTSDEVAEVATLPAVETAPPESQPPEGEAGDGGLCGAPALLLLVGLVLVRPWGRRRYL